MNFKSSVEILKNLKTKENQNEIDSKIIKIYSKCGWSLLKSPDITIQMTSRECFSNINFDPQELI